MKNLFYFKFTVFSLLAAVALFAYSIWVVPNPYKTWFTRYIIEPFIVLIISSIAIGYLLDVLAQAARQGWYKEYQVTVNLAIWSAVVCIISLYYAGGGQGLGTGWLIIFSLPTAFAYRIAPFHYENVIAVLWIFFSAVQGAVIGFVIDFLRR